MSAAAILPFSAYHDLTREYAPKSDFILGLEQEGRERQAARRFSYCLTRHGGEQRDVAVANEYGLPSARLIQAIQRQGLEKCLRRESSHLLTITEQVGDLQRHVADIWLGSWPNIKLTDWRAEYNRIATRYPSPAARPPRLRGFSHSLRLPAVKATQKMYKYLEIRRFTNEETVKRFDITDKSDREIERLEDGVNQNLNQESFFTAEAEYAGPQPLSPNE